MMREQTIAVWQKQVRIRVLSQGSGPALMFFHGSWGLSWDPFLDELAKRFTVYAPEHPGTSPDTPDDIYHLDNLWDLVLCYDELMRELGLTSAALVGHSFGAMVACEVAATFPGRAGRLVLIDPLGLWRDADPIPNWMVMDPPKMRAHVFSNPDGEAARRLFGDGNSDDPKAVAAARGRLMWALGATGKFLWPIPDKGLKRRIHRVTSPTLLVWGKEDRLVPPVYADEFTRRIAGARVHTVGGAGHAPHLEQPEPVARVVGDFLM